MWKPSNESNSERRLLWIWTHPLIYNQIDFIDSNAFYNLSNLASLNLNNNKLKQIKITELIQLKYLHLKNNELESIIKGNSLNLSVINLKSNKTTAYLLVSNK